MDDFSGRKVPRTGEKDPVQAATRDAGRSTSGLICINVAAPDARRMRMFMQKRAPMMAGMIDSLREEHRNFGKLLDVLEGEIELTSVGGDPDWNVLHAIASYFCEYPDRGHHPKEDAVFRRLQARFPEAARPVGDLLGEHQEVRLRVQRFRDHIQSIFLEDVLPRERLVGAARAFMDAEWRHMQREEEMFYPLAEKHLAEYDWQWIGSQLRSERDLQFRQGIEQVFQIVRNSQLARESSN
jgi:hemerythrin-like domain-containing protein